jgi:hypothetical protein
MSPTLDPPQAAEVVAALAGAVAPPR